MHSARDDLGLRSAGALHQYLRRAGSRSCHQCYLRLCNPGAANWQDMAAAYVTKEETGRMCGVLGGSLVNLPFPCPLVVYADCSTAAVSRVSFDLYTPSNSLTLKTLPFN